MTNAPPVPDDSYLRGHMMMLDMAVDYIHISVRARYAHDPANFDAIMEQLDNAIKGLETVKSYRDCSTYGSHAISCGCIPISVKNALIRSKMAGELE